MGRREWGSGSVYPVKGGRYWRVAVSHGFDPFGQRIRRDRQFRTEKAARRYLEGIQRRLARGLPPEESTVTLAEYADEWLSSLPSRVKPATVAMYGSLVRHQLGELGAYRVTRIMPQDIRSLLAERQREGYSGRTRTGILTVLRKVLRMAQGDGLIDSNPAELVDAPRLDAKEPIHFTAEQARRFLEAAKDDNLGSLYTVALSTGLRRGELLALSWRDVGDGILRVRASKTAAGVRAVPLSRPAMDALSRLARRPGPIWPYDPSYVTRHLKVVCRRAGVPELTFHQLRHSTASILLAEGVPIETIRAILGHSRVEMSRFYARPEDEAKREALERLGKAVAQ